MATTAAAAASIVSIERAFISQTAQPSYPGILPPASMSARIQACMADQLTASKIFVHPHALCESTTIGENTRIWAFAHVLPGARIGKECNICDHVFIENDVVVGDRVTIKCGVQLWDGLRVADDVFIGPNVSFTNDRFPRSKKYPESFPRTLVRTGASIGANATILPGVSIGE